MTKSTSPFTSPVFLGLVLLFATVLFFTYSGLQKTPEQPPGTVELYVKQGTRLMDGQQATAVVLSSCGPVSIYLDGQKLSEGDGRLEADFTAVSGSHEIEAKTASCTNSLVLTVIPKECEDGQTQECSQGACSGVKKCRMGVYSSCILPKKICIPGEKTSCSTNACSFGYTTCNECGTAFGPCLPPGDDSLLTGSLVCPPEN